MRVRLTMCLGSRLELIREEVEEGMEEETEEGMLEK